MSEGNTRVTEVQRWLIYAERDLQAAQLLLNQGNNFRHDLDLLRNLLPADWRCCLECLNLAQLTQWAVEARYPSLSEDPSYEDAQISLQQAQ